MSCHGLFLTGRHLLAPFFCPAFSAICSGFDLGHCCWEPRPVILNHRCNGGFVRKADISAECGKGLLPAISTSGGMAASYGSGYALEVMREHMERMWW